MFRRSATVGLAVAALWAQGSLASEPPREEEQPKEIGLMERSQTRLAQLDITVVGPPEAIASLTAEDFRIKLNLTKIENFRLDRLCDLGTAAGSEATGVDATTTESRIVERPGESRTPSASYLFYFDQTQLTLAGRQRALDIARILVERLITDGHRAMIASNAAEVAVIEPFTSDPSRLLAGLERLEHDRHQWDAYAQLEDSRVAHVIRALNEEVDVRRAIAAARTYQKEESWRAERSLRRLRLSLGQLTQIEAPKAVIYFADTLRSNPGAHFLSFFGANMRETNSTLGIISTDSSMAGPPFDAVVNEASAQGIRFYTVQAQGLVSQFEPAGLSSLAMARTRNAPPSASGVRISDAKNTLANLATETGGHAFLNGVRAAKIAERIRTDSSCLFLASFDPTGFAEDSALRAKVKLLRDDVQIRVRGRIVLQSEAARRTSALLRAFGSPETIVDPFDLRASLVPTGFDRGSYSALLQLSVPATPLHGATWDIGATMSSGQKVRDESSGRLSVSGPMVPVIFESQLSFKPGEHEIVSVAHEAGSGLIASEQLKVDWPDPDGGAATMAPIALLQPTVGAFLRDGATRNSGSLAIPPTEPALTDRATALVGLVCRGRRSKDPLTVERSLEGASSHPFPPLEIDSGKERCAQVRDLVPADTLEAGFYRYVVRVRQADRTLHEQTREFAVVGPAP